MVREVAFNKTLLLFEVLQSIVVVAGQSAYSCRLALLKLAELSVILTLLEAATNEYHTSGLAPPPPPVPHGLVIAVYVAATEVPDILVQVAPCVMLMADPQLSLEGCANKILGIQIKRKA